VPFELDRVLHASDAASRDAAWEELVARHTRLFLSVARSLGGSHDDIMERYAFVLEKLAEDDCHRLRAFRLDGRARFSTWLAVTARRLCLDHYRSRFGRNRVTADPERADALRTVRRRLAGAAAAELDTDLLPDESIHSADRAAIERERDEKLQAALTALPPRDRLLLALRFEDDLPAIRIAGLLGMPTPFHVYRRLNRVLASLRAALVARGVEGTEG
jgi:RNA polymerase sigma factor (sigma-70 family)